MSHIQKQKILVYSKYIEKIVQKHDLEGTQGYN